MLFMVAAVSIVLLVAIPQLRFMSRRKKTLDQSWEDLVASVEEVNLEGIRDIANMFLNPTKDQLRLEPPTMWRMIGGFKGMQQMRRNADAMLQLCVYAERWDFKGAVISEMIRLDAINLNKAITRVERSVMFGLGKVRSHFAIMEVAAHYELMRRRVLGQYERTHAARLPLLVERLGA